MNYLTLCKRLRLEAGISGTGPAAVAGQTGEMLRVVEWIAAAYEDVQTAHATWRFLREDFSFPTIADTQEYTPAAASITDLASWIRQDMRLYLTSAADEQFLQDMPWDDFRIAAMYGSNRLVTGRPILASIKPNNSLMLWQTPDDVYTVLGEYYTVPDVMALDADIPIIPARFHLAIVWKALMYYGAYTAADEKYAHGKNQYSRQMRALENDQLERIRYGEPLA